MRGDGRVGRVCRVEAMQKHMEMMHRLQMMHRMIHLVHLKYLLMRVAFHEPIRRRVGSDEGTTLTMGGGSDGGPEGAKDGVYVGVIHLHYLLAYQYLHPHPQQHHYQLLFSFSTASWRMYKHSSLRDARHHRVSYRPSVMRAYG